MLCLYSGIFYGIEFARDLLPRVLAFVSLIDEASISSSFCLSRAGKRSVWWQSSGMERSYLLHRMTPNMPPGRCVQILPYLFTLMSKKKKKKQFFC